MGEPDIALLTMVNDTACPVHFSPVSTAIVVEDEIVMHSSPGLTFALLFGMIYAIQLDYHKKLINTFTFFQKELIGLDDAKPLKTCLLCLKNDLLLKK